MEIEVVQLGVPGPAQSDTLIHFCGRPAGRKLTPGVPNDIGDLSPEGRLSSILWDEGWRGFPPFGADPDQPAVCFSESPHEHLKHLLHERRWPAWGIVVTRQSLYAAGGGPVYYARPERYDKRSKDDKPWMVRFEANPNNWSDWTHERQWRVVLPATRPFLSFNALQPVAILVGDPMWEPARGTGYYIDRASGELCGPDSVYAEELSSLPGWWDRLQRWWWHEEAGEVVRLSPTVVPRS